LEQDLLPLMAFRL